MHPVLGAREVFAQLADVLADAADIAPEDVHDHVVLLVEVFAQVRGLGRVGGVVVLDLVANPLDLAVEPGGEDDLDDGPSEPDQRHGDGIAHL